jgi:hypothetical protein
MDIDDESTARFKQRVEQRLQQLQSQLEINAKFNSALTQAAGMDTSKLPPELLRELKEEAERVFKAEPPPLPSD